MVIFDLETYFVQKRQNDATRPVRGDLLDEAVPAAGVSQTPMPTPTNSAAPGEWRTPRRTDADDKSLSPEDFRPRSPDSQDLQPPSVGSTASLPALAREGGIPLPQTRGICLPGVKSVADLQAIVAAQNAAWAPPATKPLPPMMTDRLPESAREPGPVSTARLGVQVTYVTDPIQAQQALAALLAYPEELGVDIEAAPLAQDADDRCAGLDPYRSRIRLLQIATPTRVVVMDLDRMPLAVLEPLLSRTLVAHNAKFELKHLLRAGLMPVRIDCTQLMARLVTGEPLLSLADCVQRALGWEVDKTPQTSGWSTPDLSAEQIEYAALDAILALKLAEPYRAEIERTGQGRAYALMVAALPVVARGRNPMVVPSIARRMRGSPPLWRRSTSRPKTR